MREVKQTECPLRVKADICAAKSHVRFAPESGHVYAAQPGMSALPRKRSSVHRTSLADDLKYSQLGIDFYFGSERDRLRNFLVKSRKHGQVSKGRTLH
jgi:hypothetical protein